MGTAYKLTWREGEQRFRKRYKGRDYYFTAPEGKVRGYRRCLREWERKKREIDQSRDESPDQKLWATTIAQVKTKLHQLRAERDKLRWMFWYQMFLAFQRFHDTDSPFYLPGNPETDDLDDLLNQDIGVPLLQNGEKQLPAPWEVYPVPDDTENPSTVEAGIKLFLRAKQDEVTYGKLSESRHKMIRYALEAFVAIVGPIKIENLSGKQLQRFKADLESRIHRKEISTYTGRDYLATAKQFITWLYTREYLDQKPRCLDDRGFNISPEQKAIRVFTAEEVKDILAKIPERLQCYIMVMLNTGATSKDLVDLRHDEVDWEQRIITRARSKTGAIVVSYPLWDHTFGLLRKYRSNHAERVLLTAHGTLLKPDTIRGMYRRYAPGKKSTKVFRATSATLLDTHPEYGRYAPHFLGHSPRQMSERHYVVASQDRFNAAVRWLGQQFGF